MQPTIVPGISTWSRWQADRAMYFNSWLVSTAEKLADPARAARSIRRLLEINVQHALTAMLDARNDAFVRRVNIGDVTIVRSVPELDYFDGETGDA